MDQDEDLQRDEVDCRHGSCLFDNCPVTDHTLYIPCLNREVAMEFPLLCESVKPFKLVWELQI